tara:strand:+ start:834 stop:1076 length:243 start_codon:yes stop_codon:yes gene_type:complete
MVTINMPNSRCFYDRACGITDGTGYTYLCEIHQREDDKIQASSESDEARRHDAHIELLERLDNPNDSFNEDDLERMVTDD